MSVKVNDKINKKCVCVERFVYVFVNVKSVLIRNHEQVCQISCEMSGKCDVIVTGFVGFVESFLSGIFLVVPLYILNERYHVEHHDLEEILPKYLRYFIWYALCSVGFWMFLICGVLKVCSKKLPDFYSSVTFQEIRPLLLPWLVFQLVVMFFDLIKNVFLLLECFIQIDLFVEWNSEFIVLIIATALCPLYLCKLNSLSA